MSADRAESGWQRDADEADDLATFFRGRSRRLLDARPTVIEEVTPLLNARDGIRVAGERLALSGETGAAISVARDDAARLERMTGSIGAADLTLARMIEWAPQTPRAAEPRAMRWSGQLRTPMPPRRYYERAKAAAATRAAPLIALRAKGIHARDWLGAARH